MSLNNQGNPYHDSEGKFTSGNNSTTKQSNNDIEEKIRNMGFGEKPQLKNNISLKSANDYVDMVLSTDRYGQKFIQHYAGEGQKGFDDLRNERQQQLAQESTERLMTLKSEINNVSKQLASKNKNKNLTRDQMMALRTLLIDINDELTRR